MSVSLCWQVYSYYLPYSVLDVYGPIISRGSTVGSVLHAQREMNEWAHLQTKKNKNEQRETIMSHELKRWNRQLNETSKGQVHFLQFGMKMPQRNWWKTQQHVLTTASTSVDSLEEKTDKLWWKSLQIHKQQTYLMLCYVCVYIHIYIVINFINCAVNWSFHSRGVCVFVFPAAWNCKRFSLSGFGTFKPKIHLNSVKIRLEREREF